MHDDDSPTRIVLTGSSAITAAGIGLDPLIESIRTGHRHLSRRDGHLLTQIENFQPKQYVRPRKALKVMCREIQTAFAASMLAAEHAGLVDDQNQLSPGVDVHRLATVFGSEMLYHPADLAEAMRVAIAGHVADPSVDPADTVAFGRDGMRHITPLWLLKHLPNMAACHVGISLGALGPNNTLVTGDVSGVDALAESVSCLRRGVADTAVVSASGTRINETRFTYRCDAPPPIDDRPDGKIGLPADPTSTGVILGEAAASVIVETAASAAARRAAPIATVDAIAQRFVPSAALSLAHRTASLTTDHPRSNRQSIAAAIQSALCAAGHPNIDLVVGHCSGDPIADAEELAAIAEINELTNARTVHPITAIGHTGAASGLLSVTVAAALLDNTTRRTLAICHTPEGSATAVVLSKVPPPT